ncbi:presequence protease, mitochondrial [Chelonus insularis]|uniref:presequence protease, mitochondrial n=1 Tax=Chelonus insularis TaxID=460826 RepID=UPI00158CA1DD|nr:presequence protease, mitochondrial [Chelonus insularis]
MLRQFNKTKCALLVFPRRHSHATQISPKNNESEKYRKGDLIHGFVLDEIARVDEMFLDAIRLTHLSTGAQYLHLNRDDSNNVFSINFRTTPMDSTGLPHILEHMTLCGSNRYPVRDPFMKMLRRSLATFLNAMTGPDYTIYPFSTQNIKDFYNLQSVYADAVFKPLLREMDFRQEGWRLEHADLNDKKSSIIFKGVVFNEMKGVFNENQWVFTEKFLNLILPSHTYSVCSGGYPLDIPKLTHKALTDFHAKYYHPSNSRIFSYGNFPFENHLKFLNDNYFTCDKIDPKMSSVPSESRWKVPRREHITCKIDPLASDPDKQSVIGIGFLCNDITDIQTTLELKILSELLLKGPNSAFYKSLVESGLSDGFGGFTGYDPQCRDSIFIVSLQGVKPENFQKIEQVFDETVNRVIDQGFGKDHVQAVLHGIEIRVKHQVSNFGMNLLFNLTSLWNHDGNLIESMRINKAIENFRMQLQQDSTYLNKLVEKYLKNNQHQLVLTMSPDDEYESKLKTAEEKLLQSKLKEFSSKELDQIYNNGLILRKDQEKEENLNILPTLKMEDLKKDVNRYATENIKVCEVPIQISIQPTNGVSYYRGILNTCDLSDDLKLLVPIFNNVISKMGTNSHDYRSFDRLCQLKTGGLHFSSHIAEKIDSLTSYEEGILISSYCLDKNTDDMWKLWIELFNEVNLEDATRFETLIKILAADLSQGIADSGHIYVMNSAASLISPIAKYKESISGLEFVGRMKRMVQNKEFVTVLEKIKAISQHVLNKEHFRTAINTSNEKNIILKGLHEFYQSIDGIPNVETVKLTQNNQKSNVEKGVHHVMPYNTNYTSKTILTVPYSHPDHACLRILAKLISSVYLLKEVREKEGAYGSGATISTEGVFTFFSFRDPNSTKTFDTFDKTYDFLKSFHFKHTDLDESKLGVFQNIDAPIAPGDRGMTKFITGLTDDDIQMQRIRLKNVTKEDVLRVAEKYLRPGIDGVKVGRAIIGPANSELLERKSENWEVWTNESEDSQ